MEIQELIDKFQTAQVLKSDSTTKSAILLGKIDGENAIVTLEKSPFNFEEESVHLSATLESFKLINQNDIYYWSTANLNQAKAAGAKITVIYPATETHIRKYSEQKYHLIRESPGVYQSKVKPFIETQRGDRIQWVYNILFHGKEAESVLYHDKDPENGFVLLPDMKWDGENMAALYLVAIVNRMDIASVRDLNSSHVAFLEKLQSTIKKITGEKYGLAEDELRIFIHYQPSYYHFHIHVVNVAHAGLGQGINIGKAILLDDVIENIRLVPDYYQKRTLHYVLGENHGLWSLLKQ
ncbi:putative m7 diphosphatase [Clavispora lusitaniae]|uniref:M7 diphosphatase n=1 Tax=Clavispora lusitaniae TaxID=36911 RepID=A0ACD0WPP0_CLALS|nr:putative m7 diphosphatase [Clavispora lusitaniae]QFZ34979.1 putative m7 diphosphatase [Clavispora lusitaniae]QFZ40664.1 putative m7 diphosphatase [Clavispora lusitaniae]QFZ46344.1 putative m7 diphosphatase [Clavispora lusitaniae]QFZ52006.1 putative m7 diphosphatase [Clavispora lusitaniae]